MFYQQWGKDQCGPYGDTQGARDPTHTKAVTNVGSLGDWNFQGARITSGCLTIKPHSQGKGGTAGSQEMCVHTGRWNYSYSYRNGHSYC